MSTERTADFYASNEGTSYPFVGPHDAFSQAFVDAAVSLPPGVTDAAALTQWDPAGAFEISAGGIVVIPLGTPVTVTSFGAYAIWEARTPKAQAVLVFTGIPGAFTGSKEFQIRAVTYSSAGDIYVALGSQEIAGPGEYLRLAAGAHTGIKGSESAAGDSEIVLSAAFSPTTGCAETTVVQSGVLIKKINGIQPGAHGDFGITGKSTYLVDKVPGASALELSNVGEPCCDCQDYISYYGGLDATTIKFYAVADELIKVQDAYRQLLAYARFLLQAPISGGIDPNDTIRIAQQ